MKPSTSYLKHLLVTLRDPEEAKRVLNAALEDPDPKVFLLALKDVAAAQGGMARAAKLTGLNRENLYRMLSRSGNPGFLGVEKLLGLAGLRFAVESKKPPAARLRRS